MARNREMGSLRSSGDNIEGYTRMHGLMSYRRFGRARSLRSDRALDRYVATELRLELGRYVATEQTLELGRYVATERNGPRPLRSSFYVAVIRRVAADEFSVVCKSCGISEDSRILAKGQILGSRIKVFDTMPRDVRDQCAGFRARPRLTPGFRGCDD
ncbi:hypothetical protein DY000_02046393 [Brassica cretica]|uniref:Uncharacterized protein n=1 Tax=Brassica cretica TaxID=69181 RepID=A0ABQ7EXS3_BRACR|nr:hypothetical protein DY000_02046393 [Brassica cretica]